MRIEIDISGQVQQKNYDSALGFRRENGIIGSVFLRKETKRKINQKYKGQVIHLVEKIHCILVYYCIKDYLKGVKEIRICRDVDKRVATNLLPKLFKNNKDFSKVKIKFISGKNGKSNGHSPALKTLRHQKYANKIITYKGVEDVLFKFK